MERYSLFMGWKTKLYQRICTLPKTAYRFNAIPIQMSVTWKEQAYNSYGIKMTQKFPSHGSMTTILELYLCDTWNVKSLNNTTVFRSTILAIGTDIWNNVTTLILASHTVFNIFLPDFKKRSDITIHSFTTYWSKFVLWRPFISYHRKWRRKWRQLLLVGRLAQKCSLPFKSQALIVEITTETLTWPTINWFTIEPI